MTKKQHYTALRFAATRYESAEAGMRTLPPIATGGYRAASDCNEDISKELESASKAWRVASGRAWLDGVRQSTIDRYAEQYAPTLPGLVGRNGAATLTTEEL